MIYEYRFKVYFSVKHGIPFKIANKSFQGEHSPSAIVLMEGNLSRHFVMFYIE